APDSQHVSVVGPTVEGGSIAMADRTPGLPPGLGYGNGPGPDFNPDPEPVDNLAGPVPPSTPPTSNAPTVLSSVASTTDPEADSPGADQRALAQADWVVQLGARVQRWLGPAPKSELEIQPVDGALAEAAPARNEFPTGPRDQAGSNRGRNFLSTAQADLGGPVSLVVIGAVAYRLRNPMVNWWRRRGTTPTGW